MPGVSGNPLGRAPRRRFVEELATVLAEPVVDGDLSSPTKMRAVALKLVDLCIAGNTKALAIFLPHVDPQRVKAAIKAGTVNVLSVANHDGSIDDLKAEFADFVASLPSILKEQRHALPGGTVDERR